MDALTQIDSQELTNKQHKGHTLLEYHSVIES